MPQQSPEPKSLEDIMRPSKPKDDFSDQFATATTLDIRALPESSGKRLIAQRVIKEKLDTVASVYQEDGPLAIPGHITRIALHNSPATATMPQGKKVFADLQLSKDTNVTITGPGSVLFLSGEGTAHLDAHAAIQRVTVKDAATKLIVEADNACTRENGHTALHLSFYEKAKGKKQYGIADGGLRFCLNGGRMITLAPGATATLIIKGKEYSITNTADKTAKQIRMEFDDQLKQQEGGTLERHILSPAEVKRFLPDLLTAVPPNGLGHFKPAAPAMAALPLPSSPSFG
ncbi:MAG: hypothetical protein JO089_01785 [Alphaproteobacteria bacterium]|nr:hypothetical protein [Alphaproteobacteria bacterium]